MLDPLNFVLHCHWVINVNTIQLHFYFFTVSSCFVQYNVVYFQCVALFWVFVQETPQENG